MAKAVRIDLEVKPVPYKIVMELTQEEAEALYIVTNLVSGSPSESSRKYIDNIGKTLLDCGVNCNRYDYPKNVDGDITFRDKI